jgi:hypothetical protein
MAMISAKKKPRIDRGIRIGRCAWMPARVQKMGPLMKSLRTLEAAV